MESTSTLIAKKAAGYAAANLVQEGMLIGLGTGSTVIYLIEALGRRCQEGLHIKVVSSSKQSMHLAQSVGIPLLDDQEIMQVDLTIDGADEIDPQKNMIKGGGGALLREKLLAYSSQEMIVIVDENKLVSQLGAFPVPVEISSFAYRSTLNRLELKGYHAILRRHQDQSIYVTDNGNYIADIQFEAPIRHPAAEQEHLKEIAGVLETGLFFDIAGRIVVGYLDGLVKIQT